jgi:membrane protein DedA with SNARE-associated domain
VFASFHVSPLLECVALFGTTFLQEGVALAAGAGLILRGDVYPAFAGLSLFLGMVAGDCGIYGLGRLAHRSASARRMIATVNLEKAKGWLDKHLLVAVATSHLVPWVLFPTFVAFGWFGLPFRRFVATSALFAALYVPAALLVLTSVGKAASPLVGDKLWLVMAAAAGIVTALFAVRWLRVRTAT